MTTPNPYLAAALEYAGFGWRVVPLHPRHKKPRPLDWVKVATADPEQVRGWWLDVPDGNVGVGLGSRSMLVAIDVDTEEGAKLLLDMAGGDLPDTLEMTTGKGSRLLFAVPDALEFEPKTSSIGVPGPPDPKTGKPTRVEILRFQGLGGQCVMPPSVHPGDPKQGIPPGRVYAWVEGRSPADLEPAPMPGWLIEAMRPGGFADERHPETPVWVDRVDSRIPAECNFNTAADWWRDVLEPAGFSASRPARGDRGSYRYCRPGKGDHSIGVTVGYWKAKDGTDALYVFSGSINGLDPGRCYDKFGAFARLFFRGDFTAAYRAAVARDVIKPRTGSRPVPRSNTAVSLPAGPAPAAWADDLYPDLGPLTADEADQYLAHTR